MRQITVSSLDDYPLAVTQFEGSNPDGPVILIACGVAIPAGFYRHFATWLAGQGASQVFTFDYRGIGGSMPPENEPRFKPHDYLMSDWARLDFTAIVSWLKGKYPNNALYLVGHSFGGQALGLCEQNDGFNRVVLIASMSGYWAQMNFPERYRVWLMLSVMAPVIGRIYGYVPGKFGLGEDVSAKALNQWGKWCRSRNYFFDDPEMHDTKNFTNLKAPMLAVGIEDDPWARPELIDHLVGHYTNAQLERRQFSNKEAGGPVGHFNFFKPRHWEKLWQPVGEWLFLQD